MDALETLFKHFKLRNHYLKNQTLQFIILFIKKLNM